MWNRTYCEAKWKDLAWSDMSLCCMRLHEGLQALSAEVEQLLTIFLFLLLR